MRIRRIRRGFSRLNSERAFRQSPFLRPNTAMPSPSGVTSAIRNISWAIGRAIRLPSDAFDTVLSIESSEHMQDKPMFFAQAHRVLKTGGRMVVCAWLAVEDPTRVHRRHLLEPICREGRLPGMGTEADYRKWFSECERFEAGLLRGCQRARAKDLVDLSRASFGSFFRRPQYRRFLFSAGRATVSFS